MMPIECTFTIGQITHYRKRMHHMVNKSLLVSNKSNGMTEFRQMAKDFL